MAEDCTGEKKRGKVNERLIIFAVMKNKERTGASGGGVKKK